MLVPFPTPLRRLALTDRDALALATGLLVPEEWPNPNFAAVIPLIAEQSATDDWVFLISDGARIIGEIGAKTAPDAEGALEIGYGVIPSARRQGWTVAATSAFVTLATARGVRAVRTDCLTTNAGSIRILERCGFQRVGMSSDEDGPLICWELRLDG